MVTVKLSKVLTVTNILNKEDYPMPKEKIEFLKKSLSGPNYKNNQQKQKNDCDGLNLYYSSKIKII